MRIACRLVAHNLIYWGEGADRKMSSVCRVCLAGDTRLHSLENNQLINIYEKLSNTKFNFEDARPRALCYVCYRNLLRCHTFSQMACRSEKIFGNLFHKGLEVTHDNITQADRRLQQHLQFGNIDGKAINAGSQVSIKDEPLNNYDIEEMTAEENKMIDVPENCMKSQLRSDENQSDQDNQVTLTIKYEPIQDVKEEGELVQVESVHEDCFISELTFEKDNSNQGNDAVEDLLNIHYQQTKQDVSKMQFCCNECHKLFFLKSELVSHIRSTHSQENKKEIRKKYRHFKTYTVKTSMNEEIDDQKSLLSCNVCDKQFNDKNELVVHMRIHTGQKLFACNVCDEQFNDMDELIVHMKIHTGGPKPFACNVCDKQFRKICTLVEHMKLHTDEKLLICHVCDKQFNQKCILIKHMTVHTGEKPFSCDVCDKRFWRKCDLVMHTRIHTGEKPFSCDVCDKQFHKKCHFVDHMLFHTGEKPFSCNVCDKGFRRKCDLDRHKKIHTGEKPFACNLCDERFRRKCVLVMHMSIHTGEKKFSCNVCDKQYNRKFELDRHMIIHTGEKPFNCNVCNKQFNLKCNLMRHMRIHTA